VRAPVLDGIRVDVACTGFIFRDAGHHFQVDPSTYRIDRSVLRAFGLRVAATLPIFSGSASVRSTSAWLQRELALV
jgi:hypothetical protein